MTTTNHKLIKDNNTDHKQANTTGTKVGISSSSRLVEMGQSGHFVIDLTRPNRFQNQFRPLISTAYEVHYGQTIKPNQALIGKTHRIEETTNNRQ